MTNSNQKEFQKRLKDYNRGKRTKVFDGAAGYHPRRHPRRRRFGMPRLRRIWLPMVLILALLFGMKAFILLRIGESRYQAKLAALDDSSITANIGSFVMRVDPVTQKLRDLARPLIGTK